LTDEVGVVVGLDPAEPVVEGIDVAGVGGTVVVDVVDGTESSGVTAGTARLQVSPKTVPLPGAPPKRTR
jgi:hypothetical protein